LTEAQTEFLRWARVGRLATVSADGAPHVVPVCPVLDGEEVVFLVMSGTAKLRNLRGEPRVALVIDDYREDWDANAGLLIQGSARFLEGADWERARGLLNDKFTQYPTMWPIERDPIVAVEPERVVSWGL
jgi:PPOX class probable F420-dependent enzyme